MFTGIIEHVGLAGNIRSTADGARIEIDLGPLADGAKRGDSIAVDGVCLTVSELTGTLAAFDAGGETLSRTTLANLKPATRVNLERALQVGDRLGGHIVQGHADGVGTIRQIGPAGREWKLVIAPPPNVGELLVEKGSITVAGISLTVAALATDGTFTCAIIPTTVEETSLADRRSGDSVNLEADIIGRYVRRFMTTAETQPPRDLSIETLKEHGYA